MKKSILSIGLLTALCAINVAAAPLTISTGTSAPWQVNGSPTAVVNPIAAGFWVPNFGDGQWVATNVADGALGGGALPGTYVFTLNIGSYFGSAGVLSLQYAADNYVDFAITSGSLSGASSCAGPDCFSNSGGAPRSLTGSFAANSVLTATVVNTTNSSSPMGLLVVGTADAPSGVPEPSTYAMMAMGGVAIYMAGRRK